MATRKPQAAYTQDEAQRATARADQLRARQARAAAGNITTGLTGTDGTLGESRIAQQRAAPRVTAGMVSPAQLTRAEIASFDRQSGGAFSQRVQPAAPVSTRLPAGTGAGPNVMAAARPAPAAAPSLTSGLLPEGRAAALGQRAGAAVRTAAASPAVRVAGRAAPVLGAIGEGVDVANVVRDPRASKVDVATQVAESAGKLATTTLGAKLGATGGAAIGSIIPGPGTAVGGVIGGLVGAGAGYFGGEELIERGRQLLGSSPDSPAETRANRFANVTSSASSAQGETPNFVTGPLVDPAAVAARTSANEGIVPVADRTGASNEVIGTFNGRDITRGESDRISGPAPTAATAATAPPPGIADNLASPAAGRAPSADFGGAGSQDRVRDITNPQSAAGRLYAQLAQDKTPTGKRVAAQFLETYVTGGTAELGQRRGLAGDQLSSETQLQRGREGDAAALQSEGIRATRTRGTPQYAFNADGSISQISDGVLSAVKDEEGNPARVSPPQMTAKQREELVTEQLQQIDPGNIMTPDERKAERARILQELAAAVGANIDGP